MFEFIANGSIPVHFRVEHRVLGVWKPVRCGNGLATLQASPSAICRSVLEDVFRAEREEENFAFSNYRAFLWFYENEETMSRHDADVSDKDAEERAALPEGFNYGNAVACDQGTDFTTYDLPSEMKDLANTLRGAGALEKFGSTDHKGHAHVGYRPTGRGTITETPMTIQDALPAFLEGWLAGRATAPAETWNAWERKQIRKGRKANRRERGNGGIGFNPAALVAIVRHGMHAMALTPESTECRNTLMAAVKECSQPTKFFMPPTMPFAILLTDSDIPGAPNIAVRGSDDEESDKWLVALHDPGDPSGRPAITFHDTPGEALEAALKRGEGFIVKGGEEEPATAGE